MSEADILYVMRTENLSRYYAIKVLRYLEDNTHVTIGGQIITRTEYENYLTSPTDPRD